MRATLAFALALCIGLPAPAAGISAEPGQHAQTFEKQITVKLDYLLFLPQGYAQSGDKKWPLIVFLHGSGESGSDVHKVEKHGPAKLLAQGTDLPLKDFVVVSPQCPNAQKGWNPDHLDALLDDILATYHVDPERVYLTGLSMGGFGTWTWAARNPERFAAIAPMCGGGEARMGARRLRNMPTWVFHGEKDPTVPIALSEQMVEALKRAGNKEVKFARYPDAGHDCWTVSYNNPELYEWFLQHKKEPSQPRRGQ